MNIHILSSENGHLVIHHFKTCLQNTNILVLGVFFLMLMKMNSTWGPSLPIKVM